MASIKNRKAVDDIIGALKNNIKTVRGLRTRLKRKEQRKDVLQERLDKINDEIVFCISELTAMGESVNVESSQIASGRKMAKNSGSGVGDKGIPTGEKMTLFETIKKIMPEGKDMKVKDITQMVLDFGYPTKIDNFTYFSSTVSNVLRKEKAFKQISRGVFQLKPSKKVLRKKKNVKEHEAQKV